MMSDRHRKFVGGVVDPEMLSAVELDLVFTFVSQVPSWKSETRGSREVPAAGKFFTDEISALLA